MTNFAYAVIRRYFNKKMDCLGIYDSMEAAIGKAVMDASELFTEGYKIEELKVEDTSDPCEDSWFNVYSAHPMLREGIEYHFLKAIDNGLEAKDDD